jgi:hypothetical protein
MSMAPVHPDPSVFLTAALSEDNFPRGYRISMLNPWGPMVSCTPWTTE